MNNKLETLTNLFEGSEIRSIWDSEKEEYYFSVIDVISVLTESNIPKRYWTDLKKKLFDEGSELYENIVQLKMKSLKDGKMYSTDTLDTTGIFRLIESVPSPKAEPFKMWLANLGKERIDEVFDPEIAANRVVNYYRSKGYSDEWIKQRLIGIVDRFKLTDIWKDGGIDKPVEFALLTNEIYKTWSGMKANEYKTYKGIRKESLRDNMTDIELALTNLGELTTRDIAREEHPKGLKENMSSVAKRGGNVAKDARNSYEKAIKKSAITKENYLKYRYAENDKRISDKD
nr:phage antirepressor protein [Bacilli bacterium]